MFERVTKESDQIDQCFNEYRDNIEKNLKKYRKTKNRNWWVYNAMASFLTGSTGSFFLKSPTFKTESITRSDVLVLTIVSTIIGVKLVEFMNKCLSFEEKSISIVTGGIKSNIENLDHKQFNFIFSVKNDMAADIEDYETLALKIIKYCDIQGNEDRISRLKQQMIRRTDSLQNQLNYIMVDSAPANLFSIRFMQYEKNPLDLISKTTLD